MDHRKRRAVFAVDGYEISATFADSRNTAVLGHVKQILLITSPIKHPATALH